MDDKIEKSCEGCGSAVNARKSGMNPGGCVLFSMQERDDHIKQNIDQCPCNKCLVKMMCVDGCDDYINFSDHILITSKRHYGHYIK